MEGRREGLRLERCLGALGGNGDQGERRHLVHSAALELRVMDGRRCFRERRCCAGTASHGGLALLRREDM